MIRHEEEIYEAEICEAEIYEAEIVDLQFQSHLKALNTFLLISNISTRDMNCLNLNSILYVIFVFFEL